MKAISLGFSRLVSAVFLVGSARILSISWGASVAEEFHLVRCENCEARTCRRGRGSGAGGIGDGGMVAWVIIVVAELAGAAPRVGALGVQTAVCLLLRRRRLEGAVCGATAVEVVVVADIRLRRRTAS